MGNSNRLNKSIHNCLLVIVVVVAELILLQKSPAPQSHPFWKNWFHLDPAVSIHTFISTMKN